MSSPPGASPGKETLGVRGVCVVGGDTMDVTHPHPHPRGQEPVEGSLQSATLRQASSLGLGAGQTHDVDTWRRVAMRTGTCTASLKGSLWRERRWARSARYSRSWAVQSAPCAKTQHKVKNRTRAGTPFSKRPPFPIRLQGCV